MSKPIVTKFTDVNPTIEPFSNKRNFSIVPYSDDTFILRHDLTNVELVVKRTHIDDDEVKFTIIKFHDGYNNSVYNYDINFFVM